MRDYRRIALLVVLLAAAAPRAAQAGEREWVVSPYLGYHVLEARGAARHGGVAGVDVDYGLTDSWGLRGSAYWNGQWFRRGGDGLLQASGVGLGAQYTFDVLKVVPYAAATVGFSAIQGAGIGPRYNAELRIGLGADYLVQRDFSVGLELRYALQAPDFNRFPYAISVVLRLSWRRQ